MNAVLAYIDTRDRRVSGRMADWNPPVWFRVWMIAATRLGDGWLWVLTAFVLIARGDLRAFLASSSACGAASLAMIALKKRFRRSRPLAQGPNHFFQLVKADLSGFDGFSFPSGHTTNAFAIGTVLTALYPSLLPVALFVALSVGASRIVLRMHFFSDVVAGAVLGLAIGNLVCLALV